MWGNFIKKNKICCMLIRVQSTQYPCDYPIINIRKINAKNLTWSYYEVHCITYRMSHRYWDNFSTLYLRLESLFLGTDSYPMTHETWQSGQAIAFRVEISLKTFIEKIRKYEEDFLCVVLGILSTETRTGQGSRVRVQVPEYRSTINNYSTYGFLIK